MESTSATAAELSAAADVIGRYRQRVADLASRHLDQEHDDLVTTIYEAERALQIAERALLRAQRVARG
ncbi:MAG: hypothetical protein ACR2HQ_00405 [Ilumatobacteraceae bacterium]